MTLEQRKQAAESRIFKAVFPNTTNHYDTLFGGTALSLMDEVAFITATRFARKRMVTVSTSPIDFNRPIPHGTIVELVGRVGRIGRSSLTIEVEIYLEEMHAPTRELAIRGEFVFVAIDADKQPIAIMDEE